MLFLKFGSVTVVKLTPQMKTASFFMIKNTMVRTTGIDLDVMLAEAEKNQNLLRYYDSDVVRNRFRCYDGSVDRKSGTDPFAKNSDVVRNRSYRLELRWQSRQEQALSL